MNKYYSLAFVFDDLEQAQLFLDTSNKQDFIFFRIKDSETLYYANNITNEIQEIPFTTGSSNSLTLFPNGIEQVTTSRAFQSSDVGKLLFLLSGVNLTYGTGFTNLQTMGVFCLGSNTIEMESGSVVFPADGELLHLIFGSDGFTPIASLKKAEKTALKYLSDKLETNLLEVNTDTTTYAGVEIISIRTKDGSKAISIYAFQDGSENGINFTGVNETQIDNTHGLDEQDFYLVTIDNFGNIKKIDLVFLGQILEDFRQEVLLLTGTQPNNPMTGDIEMSDFTKIFWESSVDSKNAQIISEEGNLAFLLNDTNNLTSIFSLTDNGLDITALSPTAHGLSSTLDYTPNITDLDFTQKRYVDTKLSRQVISIDNTTLADNMPNVDYVYNITNGATLNLPTAVGNTSEYKIKNVDTISCDIIPNGAETIDGISSIILLSQYDTITVISDGINWLIY